MICEKSNICYKKDCAHKEQHNKLHFGCKKNYCNIIYKKVGCNNIFMFRREK